MESNNIQSPVSYTQNESTPLKNSEKIGAHNNSIRSVNESILREFDPLYCRQEKDHDKTDAHLSTTNDCQIVYKDPSVDCSLIQNSQLSEIHDISSNKENNPYIKSFDAKRKINFSSQSFNDPTINSDDSVTKKPKLENSLQNMSLEEIQMIEEYIERPTFCIPIHARDKIVIKTMSTSYESEPAVELSSQVLKDIPLSETTILEKNNTHCEKYKSLVEENQKLKALLIQYDDIGFNKMEEFIITIENENKTKNINLVEKIEKGNDELSKLDQAYKYMYSRYDELKTSFNEQKENEIKYTNNNIDLRKALELTGIRVNEVLKELNESKSKYEAEITKLNTTIKLDALKINGLESSLLDVQKHKDELTLICEEMLNLQNKT